MFGLSAAAVAGIGLGTSVIGTGLSMASAAGAFNGPVDKWQPTPEEMEAAKWSKKTFDLSQKLGTQADALTRKELEDIKSAEYAQDLENRQVNQFWGQAGDFSGPLTAAAQSSGGPGSGRWLNTVKDLNAGVNRGVYQAKIAGQLAPLEDYTTGLTGFVGRRAQDLRGGLGAMTSGGNASADAQAQKIQGQVANNIATSQAISGIGGSIAGVGSGLMGAAGKMKA